MKRDVLGKKLILSFIILLVALLSVSFILAQDQPGLDDNIGRGVNNFANAIDNFYQSIGIDSEIFTILMLGILLWMIIYSVIKRMRLFGGEFVGAWSGLFSLIVTILAFIGLPREFIQSLLFQYSAMGATIITAIPFLIMFYFTVFIVRSKLMARAVWLVYTIYFFSLGIFYIANNPNSAGNYLTASNIPYFGGMIIGIIVLVYLGFIRRVAFLAELDSKIDDADRRMKRRVALDRTKEREASEVFDRR